MGFLPEDGKSIAELNNEGDAEFMRVLANENTSAFKTKTAKRWIEWCQHYGEDPSEISNRTVQTIKALLMFTIQRGNLVSFYLDLVMCRLERLII